MNLPRLFKLMNTGAIQQWEVGTNDNDVHTHYGQVDGAIQSTSDTVYGKNLGKKNETSDQEQAELKAKQLWDAKIKDGYVEDLDQAKSGNTGLPGIEPMLAFPKEKKEKHIEWPMWGQPKVDGTRMVAIITNGHTKLYSRSQKEINTLPHIVEELNNIFEGKTLILDGECYNHALKHDFNKIISTIKRDDIHADHKLIEYHIYDVPSGSGGWKDRTDDVFLTMLEKWEGRKFTKLLKTVLVKDKEHMDELFSEFLLDGYEGLMLRSMRTPYENKRSAGLLKVKVMQDDEFEIVGVQEGMGKLQGKAGSFVCIIPNGRNGGGDKFFNVKMKGTLESLEDYLVNFEKYKGKKLTVQYQDLTPDRIPRFPIGIRIRVEE